MPISHYYQAQAVVIGHLRFANQTNKCPVCRKRDRATWPNGEQRITCGDRDCFHKWLPGHYQPEKDQDDE